MSVLILPLTIVLLQPAVKENEHAQILRKKSENAAGNCVELSSVGTLTSAWARLFNVDTQDVVASHCQRLEGRPQVRRSFRPWPEQTQAFSRHGGHRVEKSRQPRLCVGSPHKGRLRRLRARRRRFA